MRQLTKDQGAKMKILCILAAFWIGATIQAPTKDDSKPHWLLVQTEDEDVTEDGDDSNEKDAIEDEDVKKRTAGKNYSSGDNLTASEEERLRLRETRGCGVFNMPDEMISPPGCNNFLDSSSTELSPDNIAFVFGTPIVVKSDV